MIAQRQFLIASPGVHFRALQLEANRGGVVLNGARPVSGFGVEVAARPISLGVGRLQAHRLFQVGQGLHVIAAGQVVQTARAQRGGVAGV